MTDEGCVIMSRLHNSKLTAFSQKLRKDMTKEEKKLWYDFLKSLRQTFYRQKVIGKYIVDFYCPAAHLVIELDGSQHYEDNGIINDAERDDYFYRLGINVLRFTNLQVNIQFENVCEEILKHL